MDNGRSVQLMTKAIDVTEEYSMQETKLNLQVVLEVF